MPAQQRTPKALLLLGLAAVGVAVGLIVFFSVGRGGAGPEARVLEYIQALEKRDLAAANSMLASATSPWPLDTPAVDLGARCLTPKILESDITATMATIWVQCPTGPKQPYYLTYEDGDWKIFKLF